MSSRAGPSAGGMRRGGVERHRERDDEGHVIADHGEVRWDAVVVTGDGKPVATYDVLTMAAKTLPPAVPPGGPS